MTLELLCLLWPNTSQNPSNGVFVVKIGENQMVAFLRKMIKAKLVRQLNLIDETDLVIWKTFTLSDDHLRQALDTIRFDGTENNPQRLNPAWGLSEYFTDALPEKTVHILVEVLKPDTVAPLPHPPLAVGNLLNDRKSFNANIIAKRPSTQGVPANFSKMQADNDRNVAWRRPPTADATIPVTLYNSIFRRFIDDCQNHRPKKADNDLVLELSVEMSRFFPDEPARAAKFREIMRTHKIYFSATGVPSGGREYQTDGDIQVDGHSIVILEVKNDIGSGGADPYAQAILYYLHSEWERTETYSDFNFPCLIITLFGAHIGFSGAVWNARPHFQVFAVLPLFWHHTDTVTRKSLARHFGAFKNALQSLRQCYAALTTSTAPSIDRYLDPRFPDHRHYFKSSTKVDFTYISHLEPDKLLFIAETNDADKIVVKFVREYSREVHEKCASMEFAPNLKGLENIGGGWKMVVMEALNEEYVCLHETTPPPGLYDHLKQRLTELHRSNLVHGDVRNTNIMVKRDKSIAAMLVDFDWSGVIGEARYPMNIYKGDGLWRPKEVVDDELIQPEHDIAMLDHMFEKQRA